MVIEHNKTVRALTKDERMSFPHIEGSGYVCRKSNCDVDKYTASYMRWKSREDVLAWLNSFDHPRSLRPVFLDTETTGTRRTSEIVEVCIVDEHGQRLFYSLVKPRTEIEPVASSIHGITYRNVMHAPHYADIHEELTKYLRGCVVIAYNVSFEIRLLKQSADRYGIAFPKLHTACLMQAYAKYHPASIGYKVTCLGEALINESLTYPVGHRAEQDAKCAYDLFRLMRVKAY